MCLILISLGTFFVQFWEEELQTAHPHVLYMGMSHRRDVKDQPIQSTPLCVGSPIPHTYDSVTGTHDGIGQQV